MATIFFCGDPHSHFSHIQRAINLHEPDAIVLAGDQECWMHLDYHLSGADVFWIHGNHDTATPLYYDSLFDSVLATNNLDGQVLNVAGIRIAGVGGVFRHRVWDWEKDPDSVLAPEHHLATLGAGNRWRGGLPLRHRSSIYPSTLAALSAQQADVLVTHEPPDLHPLGKAAFTRLAGQMGVRRAFHGHVHELRLDYPGNVWCGLSLRGIVAMDTASFALHVIDPGQDEVHEYRQEKVIHSAGA